MVWLTIKITCIFMRVDSVYIALKCNSIVYIFVSSLCVGVGQNLIRVQNGSPRNVSLRCLPNHAQLLVSKLQTVGGINYYLQKCTFAIK